MLVLALRLILLFCRAKRCSWLGFYCSSRLPGGGGTFFAAAKKVTKESSFYPHARWLERVVWFNDTVAAIGLSTHNEPLRQPRDYGLEKSSLSGPRSFFRPCAARAENVRTESRSV